MDISIPTNRYRFPIAFAGYLLLTVFFTLNLFFHWDALGPTNDLTSKIIGALVIGFGLFFTIITLADYIKTLFDKKALLKISEAGLDDNLSLFSCGQIPWEDITGAEIIRVFKSDLLIIRLSDNDKYVRRQKPVVRVVLKKYVRQWNTPVVISAKRVDYDIQDLKKIILNHVK